MTVATYLSEDKKLFRSLKAKTSGRWTFLVSGEWSQSPYHQGDLTFLIRRSVDKRSWTVLRSGFQKKIVAAARFDEPASIEFAGSSMLRLLREQDGEYIDYVEEFGDIDKKQFWSAYNKGR